MHKHIQILQKDVVHGSFKAEARLKCIEKRMAEASSSAATQQMNSTTKVKDRIAGLETTILERINSINLVPRTECNFSSFNRSRLECITLALLLMRDPLAKSSSTLIGKMHKGSITISDVRWSPMEFEELFARCHQELAIKAREPIITAHRPDLGTSLTDTGPNSISRSSSRLMDTQAHCYRQLNFIRGLNFRTTAGLQIVEIEF